MSVKKKNNQVPQAQEDNLLSTFMKVKSFVENNQKQLLIAVVFVVAVVVVAILLNNRAINNKKMASAKLTGIIENYNNFNLTKALNGDSLQAKDGLLKIADEYSSTNSGNVAKLLAGNVYYSLGNFDKSHEMFEGFTGASKLLKAASISGQAATYEATGDYAKAADFYFIASKESSFNPLNSEYLLKASNSYILSGNYEKAEDILNLIKKDYAKTKSAREVERYFGKMNAAKILG